MAELESEDIEMLKGNIRNSRNVLHWNIFCVPATVGVKQDWRECGLKQP